MGGRGGGIENTRRAPLAPREMANNKFLYRWLEIALHEPSALRKAPPLPPPNHCRRNDEGTTGALCPVFAGGREKLDVVGPTKLFMGVGPAPGLVVFATTTVEMGPGGEDKGGECKGAPVSPLGLGFVKEFEGEREDPNPSASANSTSAATAELSLLITPPDAVNTPLDPPPALSMPLPTPEAIMTSTSPLFNRPFSSSLSSLSSRSDSREDSMIFLLLNTPPIDFFSGGLSWDTTISSEMPCGTGETNLGARAKEPDIPLEDRTRGV